MPFKIKKTVSTTAPSGNSVLFNGSNQYLTATKTGGWLNSANNFTLECWVYFTRNPSTYGGYYGSHIAGTTAGSSGWEFGFSSDGVSTTSLGITFKNRGGVGVTRTFNTNTWYHVAIVRSGTTVSMYIDGTLGSYGTIASWPDNNTLHIGALNYSPYFYYFPGYISNFRIVDGTEVYTSNFTPSTSPLTAITNTALLTCQSATIIDNSTNNFAITNNNTATVSTTVVPFTTSLSLFKLKKNNANPTAPSGNSVLFNGSNQYLSLPNTSSLNLGSNNFTMEAWVYPASISGNKNIFYINGNAGSYSAICLYVQDSQFAFLASQTGGYPWTLQIGAVGPTISSNTWYHVATTRSGNSFYVFVNGTLVSGAPYTLSGALFNGTTNIIGYQPTVPSYFNGYISNARIINGTALYTASFAVPTAPLTAIANTSLLTCNSATIFDGSSNNFAVTNNNTATVSSTITPFTASISTNKFKLKQVSYVRSNYMTATGGDLITTSGSYKIHTFTTVGTSSFTISSAGSNPSVEYLIVGGGGAGGSNNNCGGGGAGGLIYNTASLSAGAYAVTIGQSGSVASGVSNGNNGGDSTFNGLIALGGGGGGGSTAGSNGGSGGGNGGGGFSGTGTVSAIGLQPTSSYGGFGNNGGASAGASSYPGGGGGGAGAAGNNGSGANGGNGGIGKAYAFAGALTYYAGGGGGSLNPGTPGTGGLGGGGNGVSSNGVGANATGYGSGGGGGLNASGGAGSPGIILIKYRYTD